MRGSDAGVAVGGVDPLDLPNAPPAMPQTIGSPRPMKTTPSARASAAAVDGGGVADAQDDFRRAGVQGGQDELAGAEGGGSHRIAPLGGNQVQTGSGGHLNDGGGAGGGGAWVLSAAVRLPVSPSSPGNGAEVVPPSMPKCERIGEPSGEKTSAASSRPPVAAIIASTVPPPPSAMGHRSITASGAASSTPRAIAAAA